MKRFNIAGPCESTLHYIVPPEPRLPEARRLIEEGAYFVVHAPRQSGKTTTMRALAQSVSGSAKIAALYFSCEAAEPAGDDYGQAELILLETIYREAADCFSSHLRPPQPWPNAPAGQRLQAGLEWWARHCPLPLALLFDEIDALRGESLRSVLRQLRAGFPKRPARFPAAAVLCGLRDVRDYKTISGGSDRLGTASPFNIKVESLRLDDFSPSQVQALLSQYNIDTTGEAFAPFSSEAINCIFELTQGQPWLTNALARQLVEKLGVPHRPGFPILTDHIEEAAEQLIRAGQTHLDSLAARLAEPRVSRVLKPILAGTLHVGATFHDDFQYVQDLGLVAKDLPVRIANPIYREVIARVLAEEHELALPLDRKKFVREDGTLDFLLLLTEFAAFWREHESILLLENAYYEVVPQLVLMAFLQRVVNGGGYIDREYGVGRGRIDLLVRWPYTPRGAVHREWQREAIEMKIWAPRRADPLVAGLEQLNEYLLRLGLKKGFLVIFDRRPEQTNSPERIRFENTVTASGCEVIVLRA